MIVNLAGTLEKLEHRCTLAVLGDQPGPACEVFGNVHCMSRRSIFDWRAAARLHELCHEKQIEIIHTHDEASQFLVAMLKLRRPRWAPPALMTFHRSLNIGSKTWRDRLRNRLACAVTGPVVAVSEERRRHYIRQNRVNAKKVLSIPNGVDADQFRRDPEVRAAVRHELGVADDDVLLGAVGHFGHEKGLDVVLDAFRLMHKSTYRDSLKLVILGTGSDDRRAKLERLAADCNGPVRFIGYQNNTARWFQAFDIFLHAPRQEAFGLVVVEAMASAVSVVAARVGGIPEIIKDSALGRLVAPESASALAEAVLQLVATPALRVHVGQQARDFVQKHFTTQIQARRYVRVYEKLLAGHTSFDSSMHVDILESPPPTVCAIDAQAGYCRLEPKEKTGSLL